MLLYIIVLLEGFVTISLEILTIRQLVPLVGNSIIVTSLIIGIFLLFLAYGYRKGGTYQCEYKTILSKNFILAGIGLGVGLSYFFIECFFSVFKIITIKSTLFPLLLYLLLIIAPVIYLLGQTVPITLNLWKKNQSIGNMGGQILHVSTLGSFLGATLTALLLLNYLGVAWSIFINFSILILLAILLTEEKNNIYRLFSIMIMGLIIYWLNISFEKTLFITTNNFANYRVITNESTHSKLLDINDSFSSYINQKNHGFAYIELIKKILFEDLKLTQKNILVLGAGGFTLSAEKTAGNHFLYVDIDKQLAPLVKKHFLSHINGDIVTDDARHYLNMTNKKYDVIVNDAYSNHITISPHLLTQEYFQAIARTLTDKGIAIFNIISRPTLTDAYSKHLDTTIRSVFSSCMAIPLEYVDKPMNIIYVCKKSSLLNDKTKYTDDLNQGASDFFNMT